MKKGMKMGAFSFVKSIFGYKKTPKLVKNLKKEHQKLLELYQKMETHIASEEFSKLLKTLNQFYYKYKKHVLFEDNFLYSKLFNKFEGYDSVIKFLEDTRKELSSLSISLERFLKTYETEEEIKEKFNTFAKDFRTLGEMLRKRIEFEENKLFILY
jgi:iron-sulfur cluster repair protein YtfE (RIC family)